MIASDATTAAIEVQQSPSAARAHRTRFAFPLVALALLALCAYFHLAHLTQAPGWDPQEGYNLDIAWNLAHGRLRLFALTSAFAQHPPLYYLQLILAIRLFGYSMTAIRALAALYALLTCATIIGVGRRILGAGPALWGALVFTAAPLFLTNTRWGYSYAQLGFVGLLCLWATWRYTEAEKDSARATRWLLLAAALAGLAAFSDYIGVAWVLFVALVAARRGMRPALLALGVSSGILAVGLLVCLLLAPSVFLADFFGTSGRAAGGSPLLQLLEWMLNYYRFLSFDPWLIFGGFGLCLVRDARARGFLLGATALLALVVLKVRPIGPSFHTAVPLLPLLALGAGVAVDRGIRALYATCLRALSQRADAGQSPRWARTCAALVVFAAIVSPLGMALASDTAGLAATLPTHQDALLATPADASATTRYILSHAHPGDLILASPTLAWAFDAPDDAVGHRRDIEGADIVQTVAQSGSAAAFYPAGLPASRWAYSVALDRARYVVVDNLVRELAAPGQEPRLAALLTQVRRWPRVYARGQYSVYERPGSA